MVYTVKFKKPGALFWRKIKNVAGDTVMRDDTPKIGTNQPFNVRVLFLSDKTRIEIPMSYIIKFSKERHFDIKEQMEKESGQRIQ